MAPGSDVNTLLNLARKQEVRKEGRERKEETLEDVGRKNASLTTSARGCGVCLRGPLNCKPFCNPTVQESAEKTPEIP